MNKYRIIGKSQGYNEKQGRDWYLIRLLRTGTATTHYVEKDLFDLLSLGAYACVVTENKAETSASKLGLVTKSTETWEHLIPAEWAEEATPKKAKRKGK